MLSLTHWQLECDDDKILWVYLDRQDSSVNTLHLTVMQELNLLLEHIETKHTDYRAVIIASKKSSGFIAGADIEQFKLIENEKFQKRIFFRITSWSSCHFYNFM